LEFQNNTNMLKFQEHETRTDLEYRAINDVKKILVPHRNLNLVSICNKVQNYIIVKQRRKLSN
jgi:hypothetical protein